MENVIDERSIFQITGAIFRSNNTNTPLRIRGEYSEEFDLIGISDNFGGIYGAISGDTISLVAAEGISRNSNEEHIRGEYIGFISGRRFITRKRLVDILNENFGLNEKDMFSRTINKLYM